MFSVNGEEEDRRPQESSWLRPGSVCGTPPSVDWLIGRIIRSIRPPPDEIVKFDSLARHYQTQAILVEVLRPQDDDP